MIGPCLGTIGPCLVGLGPCLGEPGPCLGVLGLAYMHLAIDSGGYVYLSGIGTLVGMILKAPRKIDMVFESMKHSEQF